MKINKKVLNTIKFILAVDSIYVGFSELREVIYDHKEKLKDKE